MTRTMHVLTVSAAALWVVLGGPSSSTLSAQATPRVGACFYEDVDYRGRYFCAGAGEDSPNVPPGANDRISSIRIFGNARVTVYRDERFRGASQEFTTSVRDLRRDGLNDKLS